MDRRGARQAHVGAIALVLALVLSWPGLAQAAPKTFVANKVTDHSPNGCTHSDCTLREAVIAANAHPGRDKIKLLARTYTLAIPGTGEDAAADGDLDLTHGVSIVGKGARKSVIDAGGSTVGEAAFQVIAGAARMSGLAVRDSVSATGDAGITLREGSSLHMSHARVINNVATTTAGDAGIMAYDGNGADLVLDHVTVANNTGGSCCDGVYTDASANLSHVTVARNRSDKCCNGINARYGGLPSHARFAHVRVIDNTGGSCCQGVETGAVPNGRGDVVLDTVVRGNTSTVGCCNGLDLAGFSKLRRVVVAGNSAPSTGTNCCQGLDLSGGNLADVVVNNNDGSNGYQGVEISTLGATIRRTTISNNDDATSCCGGLIASGAPVKLTNVTVSHNTAATDGGGIDAYKGPISLNNVTVTRNRADSDNSGGGSGGGIFVPSDPSASLTLKNSIVAGNSVGSTGSGPDCAGTLISKGHNLIGNTTGCTITGATASNITGVNPLLAPLHDNGGFTETHALRRHSKAIDHGSPKPPGSGGRACARTDQRGVKRPQGPRCDIGAYEKKRHRHHH